MSLVSEIKGKRFLITGGASGLGAAYAEAFLKAGAKKIAILDVAEDIGKDTTAKLNSAYQNRVTFVKCDVSDEESIVGAFQTVLKDIRLIDVIINNAGIFNDSPELWRKSTEVNWQGVISLTMKGLDHMRKENNGAGGTIVNISSIAALGYQEYIPIYGGSKLAVLFFSQSLAEGLSYDTAGVRLLTFCIGATDTAILNDSKNKGYDKSTGAKLNEFVEMLKPFQKVENAVAGCVEMLKTGSHGSVWLAVNDKPLKDITQNLAKAFKEMQNTWTS